MLYKILLNKGKYNSYLEINNNGLQVHCFTYEYFVKFSNRKICFERPNDKPQKPNNIQISISNIQTLRFKKPNFFEKLGFFLKFVFAICLKFIFCRLIFIMTFLEEALNSIVLTYVKQEKYNI